MKLNISSRLFPFFEFNILVFLVFCLGSSAVPLKEDFPNASQALMHAERPFIWVKASERAAILEKINTKIWAKELFQTMQEGVDFYVDQHVRNPAWILGRIQLTWSGPNFTDFKIKNGKIIASGNAQHPTVRFMLGKMPRSAEGHAVAVPDLEDIPAFNKHPSGGMRMTDRITGEVVMVEYIDRYLRDINRRILEMAVDASVLFYLTGEEKYASFSADILSIFCEALRPMKTNASEAKNWGLISNNHLLEARWFSNTLPIIYDFIEPYIKKNPIYDPLKDERRPFNKKTAQDVFRKYIDLALNKGILNCNWVVFESSSLVNNALALDDPMERNRYMEYFLFKDTPRQQSMQTFMKFFTEDDFWFESLSYGNETINFLTYLISIADRHYPDLHLLDRYPVIFNAIHVMQRFRFPNGDYVSFGDSHRQFEPNPYPYELVNRLAKIHGKEKEGNAARSVLLRLIDEGLYRRSDYGLQNYVYTRPLKLLWFEPEIKGKKELITLSRTDSLAHAGLVLQRNAKDAKNGMMVWQGGGHHVHAHAGGMDMELYGQGAVVGSEGGKSDYQSKIHKNYYRLYAAHNTVIVNNASRGKDGWIGLGQETVELVTAEPKPRQIAVSPECSFVTTRFTNIYGSSAKTAKQLRTVALIRTSDTTGYYLDIYRSITKGRDQFHDYVYHNIGDVMQLTGDFKQQASPQWFGDDIGDVYRQPGTSWFKSQYSTGMTAKAIKGTWRMTLNNKPVRTRVWFPEGIEREYLSVIAPPTLEAPKPYNLANTPVLVARRKGEAWTKPFEAIYEIYPSRSGASIREVKRLPAPAGLSVLQIKSETSSGKEMQTVFSGSTPNAKFSNDSFSFTGSFAVLSEVDGRVEYIYLGDAFSVSFMGWNVSFADHKSGAVEVRFRDGVPKVNSQKKVIVKREH